MTNTLEIYGNRTDEMLQITETIYHILQAIKRTTAYNKDITTKKKKKKNKTSHEDL